MILGEFRQMTAHLSDNTEMYLLANRNTNDAQFYSAEGVQVEFLDGSADIHVTFDK